MAKQIAFEQNAREQLLRGIDQSLMLLL